MKSTVVHLLAASFGFWKSILHKGRDTFLPRNRTAEDLRLRWRVVQASWAKRSASASEIPNDNVHAVFKAHHKSSAWRQQRTLQRATSADRERSAGGRRLNVPWDTQEERMLKRLYKKYPGSEYDFKL